MLHKTKTGKLIPIASMEDSHLLNTIKIPFKKYNNTDEVKLSFLIGKSFDKLTIEKYNNIIHNIYMYIIEGLRRKSTRNLLIGFLSKFNPIFLTEEIEINTINLMLNVSEDFIDEVDELEENYSF